MSVRRRAIKARVERKRRLTAGFARMSYELSILQRVIEDARSEGLKTLTQAQFAQRLARTRKMHHPNIKPICAGCGFAHLIDYKDCVWLKNPY